MNPDIIPASSEPRAEIVSSTAVTQIVGARNGALGLVTMAADLMERAQRLMGQAEEIANTAHGGAPFTLNDRSKQSAYRRLFHEINATESIDAYRRHLDARVWTHLRDRTGMGQMMDRTAKECFNADLCGDVPEITEENIRATLDGYASEARLIFLRGLAHAFSSLDRRFRSHDAFKLGDRVVLTNVFDAWGSVHHSSGMDDTIADLERVFATLDGVKPEVGALVRKIRDERAGSLDPRQSVHETPYFRVRCFKNGNAHFWFLRDDLVTRANELLAEFYGAALPDAVPEDVAGDALRSFALSRDLAFYPTPPAVVSALRNHLHARDGMRVLEPSAGEGHIAADLVRCGMIVHAIEVHPERARLCEQAMRLASRLRVPPEPVQVANFLQVPARPDFDAVVMNPPFCGTHWMAHVRHAFDFLKPGGRLLAVLPATAELGESTKHDEFRAWLSRVADYRFHDLPPESFASSGTRISTSILRATRRWS